MSGIRYTLVRDLPLRSRSEAGVVKLGPAPELDPELREAVLEGALLLNVRCSKDRRPMAEIGDTALGVVMLSIHDGVPEGGVAAMRRATEGAKEPSARYAVPTVIDPGLSVTVTCRHGSVFLSATRLRSTLQRARRKGTPVEIDVFPEHTATIRVTK